MHCNWWGWDTAPHTRHMNSVYYPIGWYSFLSIPISRSLLPLLRCHRHVSSIHSCITPLPLATRIANHYICLKVKQKNNSQYIWHVILLLAHCHLCIGVWCACVHLRGWKSLVFDKWKSENCVATVFVVTIVVVAVIVIIFVVIAERVRHTGQCIHT